jgi:hypothetical protein
MAACQCCGFPELSDTDDFLARFGGYRESLGLALNRHSRLRWTRFSLYPITERAIQADLQLMLLSRE